MTKLPLRLMLFGTDYIGDNIKKMVGARTKKGEDSHSNIKFERLDNLAIIGQNTPNKTTMDYGGIYVRTNCFACYRIYSVIPDYRQPKADPPIPPIIPVCKSTWWDGCKSGRFPKPIKLSERCTVWKAEDIHALIKKLAEQPPQ